MTEPTPEEPTDGIHDILPPYISEILNGMPEDVRTSLLESLGISVPDFAAKGELAKMIGVEKGDVPTDWDSVFEPLFDQAEPWEDELRNYGVKMTAIWDANQQVVVRAIRHMAKHLREVGVEEHLVFAVANDMARVSAASAALARMHLSVAHEAEAKYGEQVARDLSMPDSSQPLYPKGKIPDTTATLLTMAMDRSEGYTGVYGINNPVSYREELKNDDLSDIDCGEDTE